MRVVKLGGSLLATSKLPDCLRKVAAGDLPTVIVPGGGVFADTVRSAQADWAFDDVTAHRMAILAMQQMALLMTALLPSLRLLRTVDECRALSGDVGVWSPCWQELDDGGVEAGWSLTSDSLAAWLAQRLAAGELIVVKAANIVDDAALAVLQSQGVLDALFHRYATPETVRIRVVNQDSFLAEP